MGWNSASVKTAHSTQRWPLNMLNNHCSPYSFLDTTLSSSPLSLSCQHHYHFQFLNYHSPGGNGGHQDTKIAFPLCSLYHFHLTATITTTSIFRSSLSLSLSDPYIFTFIFWLSSLSLSLSPPHQSLSLSRRELGSWRLQTTLSPSLRQPLVGGGSLQVTLAG